MIGRRGVLAGASVLPFVPRLARAAGDTLTFGLSSYPPSLQPWTNVGTAALAVKTQIFRGLLSFAPDGNLQGEIAESWAQDGETGWRFQLRDAVFHNGAPVTSEDVKWSLEQITGPKSTAYLRGQLQGIQSVETPDAKTVRIVMKEPTVTLPLLMALPFAAVVAKESAQGNALPVGCGPYALTSQERGVGLELAAFPKFYKPGFPRMKRVHFVAYADENLRVAALQAGDVDMIEYVPWQSMDAIEKDARLHLSTVNGPYMALAFNGGSGPFKDVRLRQAVAHAVHRDSIVKAAFFGRGEVLETLPIISSSPFYDTQYAHSWNYDLDAAKKLMAEVGVPNGFSCTLLSTAHTGMHKSTAEVVQQDLAAIGIQVKLDLPDWATRVMMGNRGQYEFCVQGQTPDDNDPDGLTAYIDGTLPPDNSRSFHLPTPKILRAAGPGTGGVRSGEAEGDLRSVAAGGDGGGGAVGRSVLAPAGVCDEEGGDGVHELSGRAEFLLAIYAGECGGGVSLRRG